MSNVSATRSELLARRSQIGLAEQGRDLLSEKRTALMREFNRMSAQVVAAMGELERTASDARAALEDALALDGPEGVGSAAMAAAGEVEVEVQTRSVAGVPIVELEDVTVARARTERGYGLAASSARIDETARRYESLLDTLLDVAAIELTLRRLAQEIESTTRRVNSLEHVVVPGLEEERDWIAMVLEQREMEDRVRLLRAGATGGGVG